MTIQDQVNQLTTVEGSSSSDQSQVIDLQSAQPTAQSQVTESVADDAEEAGLDDEEAEEEADAEDTASDETATTESLSEGGAANLAPTPNPPALTEPTAERDERSDLERQPYDFDHCTVQIAIQLLPDDGDPNGRSVVVGVRSHLDAPILRLVRLDGIGPLPPLVATLLDELKVDLPAREQAAREAFEKKKEEKAKRKSAVTSTKTPRGKKTKATLATAPASSNPIATDPRPRPEVRATTASQQQMGLF